MNRIYYTGDIVWMRKILSNSLFVYWTNFIVLILLNLLVYLVKRNQNSFVKKKDDAVKEKIAQNMGRVGDGVLSLSYVTMQREIETWESTAFNLTDKLYDMEEEEQTDRVVQKMSNLKKRLLSLEENISESKKRCAKLDNNKSN